MEKAKQFIVFDVSKSIRLVYPFFELSLRVYAVDEIFIIEIYFEILIH